MAHVSGIGTYRATFDVTADFIAVGGANTIEIVVASTLTNRMLERGYAAGWTVTIPTVQDYGLQGEVSIVPYAKVSIY